MQPPPDVDVVVIGAGAAGLFAATEAASRGARCVLLEKNRRAGVKILASGGTKCNVTSTLPIRELGRMFGARAERFLRHGLHACGPAEVRALLDAEGVPTAEFPLEKVFPKSFRAGDVLDAFLARLRRSGAELRTEAAVLDVEPLRAGGFRVATASGSLTTRRLAVTSGGCSYPKTGCTGDGYGWLEKLGHTVVAPRPALVPLVVDLSWVRELTGIAVEDAVVSALDARGRPAFRRRRPLLFTHRGLSGPGPMDVSRYLDGASGGGGRIMIDWLPDLSESDIEAELRAGHGRAGRVADHLADAFPRRLVRALLGVAGVPDRRRGAELRRGERLALARTLKRCVIAVDGNEGFDKAEVTAGGVSLDEVDPRTMQSRRVEGLYVAGEILDVDGPIGGFNFQAAFSTGSVAGRALAGQSS